MQPAAAEPLPPKGIPAADLHDILMSKFGLVGDDLFRWMAVDHPVWGRTLAQQLDQVRADCAKQEKAP